MIKVLILFTIRTLAYIALVAMMYHARIYIHMWEYWAFVAIGIVIQVTSELEWTGKG